MAPEQQLERSMLDGKDREELHAIAGAMGVKGVTRLRKADLVDAILAAAGSAAGNGGRANGAAKPKARAEKTEKTAAAETPSAAPTRAVRSKKASELADDGLAALAEEENALAGADEPELAPRPIRRRPSAEATETTPAPEAAGGSATPGETGVAAGETKAESAPGSVGRAGPAVDADDERASYGEGNRTGSRRRRRRGRDRERGGERGERMPDGDQREFTGEPIDVQGLLDLRDEGYGFLRTTGYLPGRSDVYVSASQVRRFALRKGDFVKGQTRPPASNEKYPALLRVDEINGLHPDEAKGRVRFEDLTPLFPDEQLRLELAEDPLSLTGRIVDLLSPIGKGQRGLVVSPPKAGKTTILKQIVAAIERNNPEVHLMVLLVDERPEEVTDMRRHVLRGEVVASTFDRPSDEHTHVAELTIERAKRLVEMGRDVVIVLDGITRLARAYNLAAPASGRIMSGGIDAGALYPPKRFFGAARNVEEGGSLTIIATALVETNSKMDEHIFEEFKGTGNMELRLDRKLAERRLYPAIDVNASSTRHEELLFDRNQLNQVWKLRRVLNGLAQDGSSATGLELLIDKLKTTKSNDEFLAEVAKAPTPGG
ncbi:MAG: transcription termination factor Rho [Actinobacteria bacterium]|nr:transcription termination factor Rho [Actinomycetota bacterium]